MIYVIVPTFGREAQTRIFVDSVNEVFEVVKFIITDDHPNKPNFLEFHGDDNCTVLVSQQELWWVGSINLALSHLEKIGYCESDIVIFANNDVEIPQLFNTPYVLKILSEDPRRILVPLTHNHSNDFISSGCRLLSAFPYLTWHPLSPERETRIDFGTARFMITTGEVIKAVGRIDGNLIQYHGDYYFTRKAKDLDIYTWITPQLYCVVDDSEKNLKNANINNFTELFYSFRSIRSPNHVAQRYLLFRAFCNPVIAGLVVLQLTFISVVRVGINVLGRSASRLRDIF